MSIEEFLEPETIIRHVVNYGYSRVRKTVRSTFKGLGMEDIAEEAIENHKEECKSFRKEKRKWYLKIN